MKKVVCMALLALLLFPVSAMARDIEQGKFEFTGTTQTNLNWSSDDNLKTDTYSLNFDGQYYVIKNLGVGAFMSWTNIKVGGLNATMWMFGPQATYNISYDDKLSFFGNVGVGYAKYDIRDLNDDGFLFRVGCGVKYFLARNVAMVGQVRYQRVNLDRSNLDEINMIFGLSVVF